MFEPHALKGERERLFSGVLSGLDRHHLPAGQPAGSPCWNLRAKPMFDALAMVAYHLLQAIQRLELPGDCQGWRRKRRLGKLLVLPVWPGRRGRVRTVLPRPCDRPLPPALPCET